jgi:O-antigen/teichoic acid export membrane protein
MVPLYTNVLTTYEYGIVDLINATINVLFPILTLAIAEAALRFALDKNYKNQDVLITSIFFVIISFIILLFCGRLVISLVEELSNYWHFFLVIYLLTAIDSCMSNFVRGIDKIKIFAIKGILYTAVFILLNIVFLIIFNAGLIGYLISIIISEVVTITFMCLSASIGGFKIIDIRLKANLVRSMLAYSIPLIPTIVAWWVMQISDKYIIIYYDGIAASGVYGIAYKIPTILSMLTSIFTQAWQISAIKSVSDGDHENFASQVYRYFTIISVIACAGLIALSKMLGTILYAKEYFIAWTYVPILLVAYLFSGLSGILASLFSAQKKTNILFHSTLVGAGMKLLMNLVLIPKFGLITAAYTTCVGFAITWAIRILSVKKIMNLKTNRVRDEIAFILILLEAIVMGADLRIKYVIAVTTLILIVLIYFKELQILLINIIVLLRKKKGENIYL